MIITTTVNCPQGSCRRIFGLAKRFRGARILCPFAAVSCRAVRNVKMIIPLSGDNSKSSIKYMHGLGINQEIKIYANSRSTHCEKKREKNDFDSALRYAMNMHAYFRPLHLSVFVRTRLKDNELCQVLGLNALNWQRLCPAFFC